MTVVKPGQHERTLIIMEKGRKRAPDKMSAPPHEPSSRNALIPMPGHKVKRASSRLLPFGSIMYDAAAKALN
jgi:hypothetical protein